MSGDEEISMLEAIQSAQRIALEEMPNAIILGQDVAVNGGVFRATDGLFAEYGRRVRDMPISEAGMVGAAIGLAVSGMVPIVELQFLPFAQQAFHQLAGQLPRMRMRTQGRFPMRVTVRAPYGGHIRAPELHSDSIESQLTGIPGLRVITPSTAYTAKGLLLAAIGSGGPVLFLEPIVSYRKVRDAVPSEPFEVPFTARMVQDGSDLTLICWGSSVPLCVTSAGHLASKGVSCAIVDVQSLYPLDESSLTDAVTQTGRGVIVHEDPAGGVASDIIAAVQERGFRHLKAPLRQVRALPTPYPAFGGEELYLPSEERVIRMVMEVMRE